jgi:DNA-binding transcriptional LysR family regulator
VARTRAAGEGLSGTLRVSFTRSASEEPATTIVEEFRRRYPDVELRASSAFTARHVEQLREGLLDVAFVRPPLYADELETLVVGAEELVLAVPNDHRLACRGPRRVERAEVREEPVVSWPRAHGPGLHDRIREQVWGAGSAQYVVREEPEEEQMLRAVARGAGVAVVTESRAKTLSVAGVAMRRFADPAPIAEIALAWRAGDPSPVLGRFLETAKELTTVSSRAS